MPENEDQSRAEKIMRPSEFMKGRRPELFSDSFVDHGKSISKEALRFHISNLSSDNKHHAFEQFATRLLQLEVCPNIRPQTGPAGGGDAKYDAATYPVSAELGDVVYYGTPVSTTNEEWGFAFSCVANWKPKIKSDIKKIAGLARKFTRVYFVSNQLIKDKAKEELEQELSTEHGFDVRIFDLNWVVDRIVNNKREDLCLILGLDVPSTEIVRNGPNDLLRKQELDRLLQRLGDATNYFGNYVAIAHDYLLAAKYSRGLQLPRHEIEGLFKRALDIAKKGGQQSQVLRILYDHAWTSFFWFEDYAQLLELFTQLLDAMPGTGSAHDLHLASNIFKLAYISANKIHPPLASLEIQKQHERIATELRRLAAEELRPNNALEAKTELVFLDFFSAMSDPEKQKDVTSRLAGCLDESEKLADFPVSRIIDTTIELGDLIGDFNGYEALYEKAVKLAQERSGEEEAGRLSYLRGMQLLQSSQPVDALNKLGTARVKLLKEGTLQNAIRAMLGCAIAYREMGLLWAARGELIFAAHFALKHVEGKPRFIWEGVEASALMATIELQLGRVAPFLAWFELAQITKRWADAADEKENKGFSQKIFDLDACFGCFILNLPKQEAEVLRKIAPGMGRLGMHISPAALIAATEGTEVGVKWIKENWDKDADPNFFELLRVQPARDSMASTLAGQHLSVSTYSTRLLGVDFILNVRNNYGAILLAENILSVLEAALAVAKWESLAFIVNTLKIHIEIDSRGQLPPEVDIKTISRADEIRLQCPATILDWMNGKDREGVADFLKHLLFAILIMITIDPTDDLKEEFTRWGELNVFSRALSLCPLSLPLIDLIGGNERYGFSYWSQTTNS